MSLDGVSTQICLQVRMARWGRVYNIESKEGDAKLEG